MVTSGKGVPRIHGDEPFAGQPSVQGQECSPYPRGWTGTDLVFIKRDEVFPVSTGMNRLADGGINRWNRVPRIHGDESEKGIPL